MKLLPFVSVATAKDEPELISLVEFAYRGHAEEEPGHGGKSVQGWTHEKGIIAEPRINKQNTWEFIPTETANILKYQREVGGEILGCVRVEVIQNENDDHDHDLYLGHGRGHGPTCAFMLLSVHPKEQGQGVGTALLDAVEEWARDRNCRRIEMSVVSVRAPLIEFYKRRGYKDTGARSPFTIRKGYGPNLIPLEFIIFEKRLS